MVSFVCLMAFLQVSQGRVPPPPMIRFTGRDGGFSELGDIIKYLVEVPYDPPNPQVFGSNSIAFKDPTIFAVFDRSYRPLRAMFAKIALVDLIVENGTDGVYTITKLPYSLYDELTELMDNALIRYQASTTTVISVSLNMQTKIQLPRTFLNSVQSPASAETLIAKRNLESLHSNPMQESDAHEQKVHGRRLQYQHLPVVKIFAPHDQKYTEFSANQKRATLLFEDWVQKENFNADKKLFDYLERTNVWTDKAAIFRCKVLNDLAAKAPAAYRAYVDSLTNSYSKYGYTNEDSFRRDLSNATTQSTMTFNIHVSIGDGKTAVVPFP